VVENRPGALGTIAAQYVARAEPDGYTLLVSSVSTHAQVPYLLKSVPYDIVKDFTQVSKIASFEWLVVADPKKGYKDLQGLISAAKKEPGKLNFGYGTASALAGIAEFNRMAGIEAEGVAYKGQPLVLTDLIGGRIDFMLVDVNVSRTLIEAKQVQPLATANTKRAALLPDVPTMAEAGLPGFEFTGWVGFSAPANTPADRVQWIADHVKTALENPEVSKRLLDIAITPDYLPPEQFSKFVANEVKRWGERIPAAGIEPQ